jgi:YHS domain-containing protein
MPISPSGEIIMTRALVVSALAGTLLFGLAAAAATTSEFDNLCTEGLALGKEVRTDCAINETIDGKTYCFGNETAKTLFMKDPTANLAKAQAYYSSKR